MSRYITRKEIATLLECTTEQVRRSEKHLGLDAARVDLNPRFVRYVKKKAVEILNTRRETRYYYRLVAKIMQKKGFIDFPTPAENKSRQT